MSLIDKNLDEVESLRSHPHGRYSGRLVSARFKKLDDEKYSLSVSFRADSALEDQDLQGVQMNQYIYWNQIITEKSMKMVKKILADAGIEVSGKSIKDAISEAEGSEAEFRVGVTEWDRSNGREDRLSVLSFRLAA